jgi:hypothetical protein
MRLCEMTSYSRIKIARSLMRENYFAEQNWHLLLGGQRRQRDGIDRGGIVAKFDVERFAL